MKRQIKKTTKVTRGTRTKTTTSPSASNSQKSSHSGSDNKQLQIIGKWPLIFGGIIILILSALLVYKTVHKAKQIVNVEPPGSEVKILPKDVKKAIKVSSPSATIRVPILMYHYVEHIKDRRDTIRQSLNVLPETFDLQIKTLLEANYTFLTMQELGEVLDDERELPTRPVVITLDDGHWDLATDVLPILKKNNIRVTTYVIPGFIGKSDFLSHQQLLEIKSSGFFEIGAHTLHHTYLKGIKKDLAEKEILGSKEQLEKDLGIKVVSFAYPYGALDSQAINLASSSGFTTAVSTVPGVVHSKNTRFVLYRLRPGAKTGESLLKFLESHK